MRFRISIICVNTIMMMVVSDSALRNVVPKELSVLSGSTYLVG